MKAIVTKYLPPTESHPARLQARAEGVPKMTVKRDLWPYSIPICLDFVANRLASRQGWLRPGVKLVSGSLPNGDRCHVFVHRGEAE